MGDHYAWSNFLVVAYIGHDEGVAEDLLFYKKLRLFFFSKISPREGIEGGVGSSRLRLVKKLTFG